MGSQLKRHVTAVQMASWLTVFGGLFAAGVLSLGHLLDLPLPCGASRGCAAVAAHPSAVWRGVPVAVVGVGAYLAAIGLLTNVSRSRQARLVLVLLSGTGFVVSAALLGYAQMEIRATCLWCVGSGVAMTMVFALSLVLLRQPVPMSRNGSWLPWGLAILTAVGLGLQAGFMQREALRPPIKAAVLRGLPHADWVDPAKSLGPEDAVVTVVLFGDFWCAACRIACESLLRYQKQQPDKVRVVYRHRPLWDLPGHQFSGTAAALSEIAAEEGRFWDFVERIHRQRAQLDGAGYTRLMGEMGFVMEGLDARLADSEDGAVQRAQRDMDLAERLGISATPTFVILVNGQLPVSASLALLPRVLNSKVVKSLLVEE